jgi:hypothetical protein
VLSLPGPVVGVDWLQTHLHDPSLRLADGRWSLAGPPGRALYEDGHLPGAVFLDADRELSSPGEGPGRHPIPTAEKLAAVLGERGIGDEHVVVAYDDAGGSIAARLWWLYRHFGRDGRAAESRIVFTTASAASFGTMIARLYCSILQPSGVATRTPEPRHAPRLAFSSSSSNHARRRSGENEIHRDVDL